MFSKNFLFKFFSHFEASFLCCSFLSTDGLIRRCSHFVFWDGTLHCTATKLLHFTALHCTTLHCTALHQTPAVCVQRCRYSASGSHTAVREASLSSLREASLSSLREASLSSQSFLGWTLVDTTATEISPVLLGLGLTLQLCCLCPRSIHINTVVSRGTLGMLF